MSSKSIAKRTTNDINLEAPSKVIFPTIQSSKLIASSRIYGSISLYELVFIEIDEDSGDY